MARSSPRHAARLWFAGIDPATPKPMRALIRLASCYERAPIREIMPLGPISAGEGLLVCFFACLILRIASVQRPAPLPNDEDIPSSGTLGLLVVLGSWGILGGAVLLLVTYV